MARPLPETKEALSPHMTTRYYRAPEVILQNTTYDEAIDVSSIGCVMGELMLALDYQNLGTPNKIKKAKLFRGNSCYPMSPF